MGDFIVENHMDVIIARINAFLGIERALRKYFYYCSYSPLTDCDHKS